MRGRTDQNDRSKVGDGFFGLSYKDQMLEKSVLDPSPLAESFWDPLFLFSGMVFVLNQGN